MMDMFDLLLLPCEIRITSALFRKKMLVVVPKQRVFLLTPVKTHPAPMALEVPGKAFHKVLNSCMMSFNWCRKY